MAGRKDSRTSACALLPHGVHAAAGTIHAGSTESASHLRHLVPSRFRDIAHHRRRSASPRCPHRLPRRVAHLESENATSPTCPLSDSRRWHFARPFWLGSMPTAFLFACSGAVQNVPRQIPRVSGG